MKHFHIKTSSQDKSSRLDKFIVEKLSINNPEISRSRIQNLINDGLVLNLTNQSLITNCDHKIKGDECLQITFPKADSSEISAKKIDFDIVFEDENMLVINKPAGLTTHPGNGNQQNTLVNALLFHCGDSLSGINGVMRPGIVHRLDKDTSGLMVVAKNDLAHQDLAKQIEQRILKRNYLALCYGIPKPMNGTIDKNIGRSKTNRLKMTTLKTGGRTAITYYKFRESYLEGSISMVECKLETGRTHQIRVHMSSIGHSLIGDQTYGGRKKSLGNVSSEIKEAVNNFPRQTLHSYKIAFLHPVSKQEMEFEIGLPEDISKLIQTLQA